MEKKFEEQQPVVSKRVTLSKDGQWLLHQTIITTFLHRNFLSAVFSQNGGNHER